MIPPVYSIPLGQVVCFNRFIFKVLQFLQTHAVNVGLPQKFFSVSSVTFIGCRTTLNIFFIFLVSLGVGVLVRLPLNLRQFLRSYSAMIGLTLTIASVSLIRCYDDRPFLKSAVVFPAQCCDNRSFLKVYLVCAVRCCDNRSLLKVCFSFSGQDL